MCIRDSDSPTRQAKKISLQLTPGRQLEKAASLELPMQLPDSPLSSHFEPKGELFPMMTPKADPLLPMITPNKPTL